MFLYLVASLLADRGVKTKEDYTVTSCEVLFGSAPAASGGDGRKAAQLVWAVANPIKFKIYGVYIARLYGDWEIKQKLKSYNNLL